jgi:hypothetical protein
MNLVRLLALLRSKFVYDTYTQTILLLLPCCQAAVSC